MKTYEVTIQATVTKPVRVQAENEEAACEQAHELFSTDNDGSLERYEQETLNVEELTDEI